MARITRGRIYKRGKKGNFYLQYYQEGKEHREVLRDEHGNPITKADAARAAADRIIAPLRFKDDAQKLRTLVNEISTLEQKAEIAAAGLKNRTATLESGWDLYLKCQTCSETFTRYGKNDPPYTSRAYMARAYYRNWVNWMREHHPEVNLLSEVTEDMTQEYIEALKGKYGVHGYSVNSRMWILKQIYFCLLNDEKIIMDRDPFKRLKPVKVFTTTKEALTIEEVQRLVNAAKTPDMRLLVLIGFCTGLRLGDCCTLQWGEVDLARRIISRIPNKMADRVPNPENIRVKVGIPSLLLNELLSIPASARHGAVLPAIDVKYREQRHSLYRDVNLLFKAANIQTIKPGSKTAQHTKGTIIKGFHSLRHTFVSLSAEAGAPQHVIQQIVGHSSPLMTMHYLHLGNADLTRSAELIPALPMQDQQQNENTGETIDALPLEDEPEERAELHRLADSLTIEQIRTILKNIPEA